MAGRQIFLHTGLAKTGTKFLQNKFFPKLKGIYYIPKPLYHKSQKIIQSTNYPRYLVSQEYDIQFEQEILRWSKFDPDTKVIIVFRRQDQWFKSEYKRYVKNGFRGSFTDFIDLKHDGGIFKVKDGFYMSKIRFVEQHMNHPPFVLIYDELASEPLKFLRKLARFLDVQVDLDQIDLKPKHTSYSEKQLKVMKKIGLFFGVKLIKYDDDHRLHRFFQRLSQMLPRYPILYIARLVPDFLLDPEPLIPPQQLHELKDFYAQDWEQTQQYARQIQNFYLN